MINETWREIKDFPNYEVSNLGNVRNKKTGKVLKPRQKNGYLVVDLLLDDVIKNLRVHRLVAKAFIPNPDNLPQVNHKDFNKSNNDVSNLEWISRADNIQHSHDNGRMQKRYEIGPVTVLTVEQVKECYTRVVRDSEGVNVVAISMGKPRTTISSIINKRSRRDITDKLDLEFSNAA